METTKQNKICSFEYRVNVKQISGRDLTDHFNEPACYTKSKRGLNKAWDAIVAAWTEETTMSDVGRIFSEYKIRYHYYYMVD
jgi:hypothetical protein